MSDHFHVLAALSPGKGLHIPFGQEVAWVPGLVWTHFITDNTLSPAKDLDYFLLKV